MDKFENKYMESLIFEKALKLLEEGKTDQEILKIFPKYQKELQEFFSVIDILDKERINITPSKHLLTKILDNISVTKLEEVRSTQREELLSSSGRISFGLGKIFNLISNFMNNKIYVLAGVTVVVLVLAVGTFSIFNKQPIKLAQNTTSGNIIEQKLAQENKSFSQDIDDSEMLAQDDNLLMLEDDLASLTEEEQIVPVDDLSNLENELNIALAGFSDDLSDLESFDGDVLSDDFDSSSLDDLAL